MIATIVHTTVLGSFLVSHALELLKIDDLIFFKNMQVFLEASLLVLKDLQFELVNFFLLILVDVVVGGLFEVVLALLVGHQARLCTHEAASHALPKGIGHHRQLHLVLLRAGEDTVLCPLGALLELLNLLFFSLNLTQPLIYLAEGVSLLPVFAYTRAMALSLQTAKSHGLLIQPDATLASGGLLTLYERFV